MAKNQQVSRKRKTQGTKRDKHIDIYVNTSFCHRPTSGRPGSPHRYFGDSYDVIFNSHLDPSNKRPTCVDHRDASRNSELYRAETYEQSPQLSGKPNTKQILGNEQAYQQETSGHQVVHRHLNGLCIITAGDAVKELISNHANYLSLSTSIKSNANDGVSVASVKYHVTVAQDAQSARGKLRARTKKFQADKASKKMTASTVLLDPGELNPHLKIIQHDGIVMPYDPLCTVALTNGMEVQLKCCVAGTVIDLNHRLSQPNVRNSIGETTSAELSNGNNVPHAEQHGLMQRDEEDVSEKGGYCFISVPIDPSLLLSDPLLNGYLAVILPLGAFPPKF